MISFSSRFGSGFRFLSLSYMFPSLDFCTPSGGLLLVVPTEASRLVAKRSGNSLPSDLKQMDFLIVSCILFCYFFPQVRRRL